MTMRSGSERKAVLNVTVAQSLADSIREQAAAGQVTVSSVVEAALAEQVRRYRKRDEGLAAMDELYQGIGYPTVGEEAAAEAWVTGAAGRLATALAAEREEDGGLGGDHARGDTGDRRASGAA